MALSKELVETNDFATKRDAYYQIKNWGEAKFDEQTESDAVMDDIEAMFSARGVSREQLRFVPRGARRRGGRRAGGHRPRPRDRRAASSIDCTRFGSGAYTIPHSVEHLEFETKAKFILAIETGGMFQRLPAHKYWREGELHPRLHGRRADARLTRRFIRRLSDEPQDPGLRLRRLRPLRDQQHLPDPQGRLGERGAHQPVLLRAPGALPRRDAPGHHRLRAPGRHPPAPGRGHQAGQGRPEERPVLPAPQGLAEGAQPDCSRWASAPSSRPWRSGASTT